MSVINRWILTADTNGVAPTGFNKMDGPTIMRKCSSLMDRASQGACAASLQLALSPIAALATITFTGNCHNGYYLVIGNVTITFETSGAAGASNQVNIGSAGDGTDVAVWVAALVNGTANSSGFTTKSTSWKGICTASVTGAVVTLTAAIPGTIGNGLLLTKTDADVTLTHLFGAATAGTEGTSYTFGVGA